METFKNMLYARLRDVNKESSQWVSKLPHVIILRILLFTVVLTIRHSLCILGGNRRSMLQI